MNPDILEWLLPLVQTLPWVACAVGAWFISRALR